jgi:hypothetical protein
MDAAVRFGSDRAMSTSTSITGINGRDTARSAEPHADNQRRAHHDDEITMNDMSQDTRDSTRALRQQIEKLECALAEAEAALRHQLNVSRLERERATAAQESAARAWTIAVLGRCGLTRTAEGGKMPGS